MKNAAQRNGEPIFLIADAGATHTRAAVVTGAGRVLGAGRSGAGNAFAIGHRDANRNLKQALRMALQSAHIAASRLAAAVVGSASVGDDGCGAEPVEADMRKYLGPCPLVVVGDARIALEGALAGAAGVVVVSGTGSIVLGKNAAGRLLKIGGWGPVAGDEGSGQWVGRRALQEAAHAYDGTASASLLTGIMCRHFQLRDFERIIDIIYAHPMAPSELGKLAPLVTMAADKGDAVARAIFAEGARALALQAVAAARRLRLRRPVISYQGSMFQVQDHFRGVFHKEIRIRLPQSRVAAPELPPLGGAFLLALKTAGIASREATVRFRNEIHA